MKRTATLSLFSYWDELRSGRGALQPLDARHPGMRSMLAGTFLIEADRRRVYPLRVLGSRLEEIAPNARLGASFLECWDGFGGRDLEALLPAVHDDARPLVLGALSHAHGSEPLSVEVLLLPLATGPDGRPRVLGGMAASASRRGAPNRLELVSARTVDLLDRTCEPPRPPATPDLHGRLRVIEGGRGRCAQV